MMKRIQVEEAFEKYAGMLYRIAFTHMKNHTEADDIVQEVFVRLMQNKPILNNSDHEKAWLIRTALNLCKDHEKAAWNKKTVELDAVPEQEKVWFQYPFMEEDEVLWAVMKLSQKYRDVIYLFYYEDYSIKEIMTVLGEQESTVKSRLKRGREALRKILVS